ncbi:MAG: hypothetical protein V1843_02835, partial [bacterium]
MQYLILILILMVSMLFYSSNIFSKTKDASKSTAVPKEANKTTVKEPLTRSEIQNLLRNLAKRPLPTVVSKPAAMCYTTVAPPDRMEYVCPKDGSKTLYTDAYVYKVDRDIPSVRYI